MAIISARDPCIFQLHTIGVVRFIKIVVVHEIEEFGNEMRGSAAHRPENGETSGRPSPAAVAAATAEAAVAARRAGTAAQLVTTIAAGKHPATAPFGGSDTASISLTFCCCFLLRKRTQVLTSIAVRLQTCRPKRKASRRIQVEASSHGCCRVHMTHIMARCHVGTNVWLQVDLLRDMCSVRLLLKRIDSDRDCE